MTKPQLRMSRAGVRAVLNSPGVIADMDRRARTVAATANAYDEHLSDGDFIGGAQAGRNRAHGGVVTATRNAKAHELRHNVLLKALQAGGD